jgi:hypothetical protein
MEIQTFKDTHKFLRTGVGKINLQIHVMKNNFASMHAMKTYGGVNLQLQSFLTLALDGGEWSRYAPANLKRRSVHH